MICTSHTSVDEAWAHMVGRVRGQKITDSRNGPQRELLGSQFMLSDLSRTTLTQPCRKFSKKYAAAEFIWYLTGYRTVEMISHYAPSYVNYANENNEAEGAYGPRWEDQLQPLLDHLRENPNTRRAVLSTYSHEDTHRLDVSKDTPCTIALQFIIRNGKLNCIATMRSNDLWLGMPYDVFCFTTLQKVIAAHLSLDLGFYWHQAGSMHLYEKDCEKLGEICLNKPPIESQFASPHSGTFRRTQKILVDAEEALRSTGKIPLILPQCTPLMADLINNLVI